MINKRIGFLIEKKRQNALFLTGKKGAKIFNQIYNGPKVPYEKLKKESEENKKIWKTKDMVV